MGKLVVKQVKSSAGASQKQHDSLRSLKLGKIGRTAEVDDDPRLLGVIRSVEHLLEVRDA